MSDAYIPKSILWQRILPGGAYWQGLVPRGLTLRLHDRHGSQGVALLCYNADHRVERYNAADTVKIQGNIVLKQGMLLYSDMGRVLFSITTDTFGGHDTIAGCSNAASNATKYGEGDYRNSRDNFAIALAKQGMTKRDIMPNVNLFTQVSVDEKGNLHWVDISKAGSLIDLRAEMNVWAIVSNCPHVLHPGLIYAPTPIELTLWQSPQPAADDLCYTASPEAIRAVQNTVNPEFAPLGYDV